jgi:hypothetical protein
VYQVGIAYYEINFSCRLQRLRNWSLGEKEGTLGKALFEKKIMEKMFVLTRQEFRESKQVSLQVDQALGDYYYYYYYYLCVCVFCPSL